MAQAELVRIASGAMTAEISPFGAELQTLATHDGLQLQWNGDPLFWGGRAPLLFPVIGMLNQGTYRHEGQTYAMPKHGFARHSRFEVATCSADTAQLRLAASDATRAIYPFEFRLDVTFSVSGSTLRTTATVANLGHEAMPASFGFHPAFRWPLPFGADRAVHRIVFAEPEPAPVRRFDRNGLLLADPFPSPVAGNTLQLRDDLFVDDALILDRLHSRSLRYGAPSGPQLQVGFEGLPTLGIWTRPGAGFICIEPWHGSSDPVGFTGDIREKPGIFLVAPGAAKSLAMTITLEAEAPG